MKIIELQKILLEKDSTEIKKALNSFDFSKKDNSGNNILHYFIKNREFINISIDDFLNILDEHNFDYNEKQSKNQKRSPLSLTILFDEKDIFNSLLNRNVVVDNEDVNGNTPLFHAVIEYRHDGYFIINLLKHKANPHKVNKYSVSPYKLANTIANTDVRKFFL